MFDIASVEASFLTKIVPIIEASINNLGPEISKVGDDAAGVVTAGNKLIHDLKDYVASIQTITNTPPPIPPAPPAA